MNFKGTLTIGNMQIPVHPAYSKSAYNWMICRDSIDGESAIKMKNELYLPMPAAMSLPQASENPSSTQNNAALFGELSGFSNPNFHTNKAYSAYLTRAQFPELASFILRGLMGLALSDEPTIKLPKNMEYLLTSASLTGQTLVEYYSYVLTEVMTTGRILSVLDVNDKTNQIVFVPYVTESVPNWKVDRAQNSAAKKPLSVVVSESRAKSNDVTNYSTDEEVYSIKILYQDENDNFSIKTKEKESDIGVDTSPNFRGKLFNGMPMKMYGPIENNFKVQAPPLYGVASSSVQIYMKYADLSNSEFMSCSPTLVISGVADDFSPQAIGSTVALILPDSDAKAYFTTTDTSALTHVMSHITDLYEQAIYSGAQLLDSSKKAAESAETVRLKQSGSGATLASVVRNVAKGIEEQLKDIAIWMGENPDEVSFLPITEFMSPALTAAEQRELVKSWVDGAISHFTLLDNFRRAGVLQEGDSIEDEIENIKNDIIKPNLSKSEGPTNDEDKDENEDEDEDKDEKKTNLNKNSGE